MPYFRRNEKLSPRERPGQQESDTAFDRFAHVLGEDFELVSPAGRRMSRADVLAGVRSAYASGTKRIWTKNERVRAVGGDLFLATYEEWQADGDVERGRLSSALLRKADSREEHPNGIEWLHVHETWME